MGRGRYISVIFSPDGGGRSLGVKLRRWQLYAALGAAALGWFMLFALAGAAALVARFELDRRALVAENQRLRVALAKADSLRLELEQLRRMRQLMERALLVADKKLGPERQRVRFVPSKRLTSSAFVPQSGLPELAQYLEDLARAEAYIPTGLPAPGVVTARFGQSGGVFKEPHQGVDILLPTGTPVTATANGIILATGEDKDLGNFVKINHLNGYSTVYGHLSEILVSPGDPVSRGEVIGYSGQSGKAYRPHLHYEVRLNGKPIDPLAKTAPKTK